MPELSALERAHVIETLQGVLAEGEDCLTPRLLENVETALASLGVVLEQEDDDGEVADE